MLEEVNNDLWENWELEKKKSKFHIESTENFIEEMIKEEQITAILGFVWFPRDIRKISLSSNRFVEIKRIWIIFFPVNCPLKTIHYVLSFVAISIVSGSIIDSFLFIISFRYDTRVLFFSSSPPA